MALRSTPPERSTAFPEGGYRDRELCSLLRSEEVGVGVGRSLTSLAALLSESWEAESDSAAAAAAAPSTSIGSGSSGAGWLLSRSGYLGGGE